MSTTGACQTVFNGGAMDGFVTRIRLCLPQQATEIIKDQVKQLQEEGSLTGGQARSLQTKLEAAIRNLDRLNGKAATNELGAFTRQVSAFIGGRVLTGELGQLLTDDANRIIVDLTR